MKLIPFSDTMAGYFGTYKRAGGNLAYVQVEAPADGDPDYKGANLAATQEVIRQYWGVIDMAMLEQHNPQFTAAIQDVKPELMQSQVISLEQFMGPFYDMPTKRLLVEGQTNDHLNDVFHYDDEETPANVIPWERIDRKPSALYKGYIQGYANAFWGGPYRMRGLAIRQIGELFNAINHELFDDFRNGMEIRLWSNDWWPGFFSAGLEWDGAYWWTLHDKTRQRITIVAISVTD